MARTDRPEVTGGGVRGTGTGRSANKPAVTATERGFSKTKAGRKEMKTNDIAISRMAKSAKKAGTNKGLADAAAPKSVSSRQKTVPTKKKGI
jgi:hypothetical protein